MRLKYRMFQEICFRFSARALIGYCANGFIRSERHLISINVKYCGVIGMVSYRRYLQRNLNKVPMYQGLYILEVHAFKEFLGLQSKSASQKLWTAESGRTADPG